MSVRLPSIASVLFMLPLFALACGDNNADNNDNNTQPDDIDVPSTYTFESRFVEGTSVSYSGQTARQVLIEELNTYIGDRLEQEVQTRDTFDDKDVVLSALTYYTQFNSDEDGDATLSFSTDPALKQSTFNDVSTGKNLVGKLAGNDSVTDHKDWSSAFVGWSDASIAAQGGSVTSPEGLLTAFLSTLAAQVADAASVGGALPVNPVNQEALPIYVTPQGHDLKQLTQKFLLMSVAFSQGADDYLDSDVDGKGLKSPNTRDSDDSTYTSLEHAWDEGFGYFGAARDYASYTDEEIAAAGGRDGWQKYHDSDGDGAIDLKSEYNFAASVNAAKRDLGSNATTDYTGQAFEAFLKGRTIIANAGEVLTDEEMTELEAQRDAALGAWEAAIAATVVHYINDTLRDTILAETAEDSYNFEHHAKVWSELKGFALGLQFNPRSPLNAASEGSTLFARVHELIGDAPVVQGADPAAFTQARANLLIARDIFKDAYGFDASNMGDDQGEGGW